ncbi:hypothetical protein H6P81_002229 [Aristolochia fimbriata]|uniref:Uncharacterized protein n=1 Tax=Aristolochia fimbriata TaxID=158543 RepID=A0AAV7FCE8_ARIFI|nr:hypothetical protein H6P81_002229 [Aristolochia fimbriata]
MEKTSPSPSLAILHAKAKRPPTFPVYRQRKKGKRWTLLSPNSVSRLYRILMSYEDSETEEERRVNLSISVTFGGPRSRRVSYKQTLKHRTAAAHRVSTHSLTHHPSLQSPLRKKQNRNRPNCIVPCRERETNVMGRSVSSLPTPMKPRVDQTAAALLDLPGNNDWVLAKTEPRN